MSASCCPRASRCGWSTSARPRRSTTPWPGGAPPSTPGRMSPAAATLRRLAWEPMARHLPTEHDHRDHRPRRRLFAPSPGRRCPATGPGPCSWSSTPWPPSRMRRSCSNASPRPAGRETERPGLLLAVGGVAYDQDPRPIDDEKTRLQLLAARPAETRRGSGTGWSDLPGTLQELDAVTRLAATRGCRPAPGRRGGHGAAAPGAAPRPLGPHRHPRLLRRSVHPLRADDPIPSSSPRWAARTSAPACATRWSSPGIVLAGANRPQQRGRHPGPRRPGHPDRRGHRRAALAGPRAGRALRLRDRPGMMDSAAARGSSASSAPSTSPAPTTSSPASGRSTTRPPPP